MGLPSGKIYGALVNAVDAWQNSLERGKEVCAVFLDLAKAFDKLSPAYSTS